MRLHQGWKWCATFALGVMATMATISHAADANTPGSSAWQEPYTGQDATGDDVIALWSFDPASPQQDASGNHPLKLRGESQFAADDRFPGVLTIEAGQDDKPQGATTPDHDDLSPAGAFTIEAWVRPAEGLADKQLAYIVDKKLFHYKSDNARANRDYLMLLNGAAGKWERSILVSLGFGDDSEVYVSSPITLEPGKWMHLAFTYDGKGLVVFYADGREISRKLVASRGAIAAGNHPLVIGDRIGSTHQRFVGSIAQVRLSRAARVFTSGAASVTLPPARQAFVRMEKDASLPLVITNDTGGDLRDVALSVTLGDLPARTIPVGSLASAATRTIDYPVDTTLAAGRYALRAQVIRQGKPVGEEMKTDLHLVNRTVAGQMPVIMWGNGAIEPIQAMGFNHQLVHLVDFDPTWTKREVVIQESDQLRRRLGLLDNMLIHQMGGVEFFNTINWIKRWAVNRDDPQDNISSYLAIDSQGEPHKYGSTGVLDPTFPRIIDYVHDMGEGVARNYGSHPALVGALIHSEVRDGTQISYHPHNQAAYRQATGQDYPSNLGGPRGTHYRQIADFPANRVVADDHPLLTFYRWFWKDGDGWNKLHESADKGFKTAPRDDLWSFFDPAVRVPSIYGSGGDVDVISQWTYTYPDPIKIGLATDELFAMAQGRPGQKVMTMTQAIWYRSQTAPIQKPETQGDLKPAPWEEQNPDAQYITIAPDIARQSLWLMLSRPVQGIMFHGLPSLLPKDVHGGWQGGSYVYTNEQTHKTLGQDMQRITQPLGATLMQVGDRPADIAFLESFTSQMFASRGGYGWANGWSADSYLILQWARLQPQVIYEETLLDKGLDAYKVLVLTDCDVLTQSVASAILRWQNRGGIIIGDERLTPAIQPDVLLPSYRRTGQADQDKAVLLKLADKLRDELQGHYGRYIDSSSPELIVRARQWKQADYLFVINDHRTYGDYVGHHRKVMEKGLPQAGEVTVARDGGFVYDVLASQEVQPRREGGAMHWPVSLDPGDGKLFLIVPSAIQAVTLKGPAQAKAASQVTWQAQVVDAQGKPVQAMLPVRVDILDPTGELAEFSGDHNAAAGQLTLTLDLPANAPTGQWTVRIKDLASGQIAREVFTIAAR